VTCLAARRLADSLVAFAGLVVAAVVSGCGGGGVSGPAVTTGALAISPVTATVFSDVPVKFVVTGGTAPYFITSSNAAALPVPSGAYNYNELTLVPGTVGADTSVTISATDAKNSTSVSSTVTVRPRTVSNVVTVTPSATCSGALCSGSDAQVSAVLMQNGVPLAGRTVRFTVASGALAVVTSLNGSEILSSTGTAVTDINGRATITVRAFDGAALQTALLDITDLTSGSTVRTAITIAPPALPTPAALAAQPGTLTFSGTQSGTCAQSGAADVIVFGGTPPYSITQPAGFTVTPSVLGSSGDRFTVEPTGQCVASATIGIVDRLGASTTVAVSNTQSSASPPPTFTVTPTAVTLSSCNDQATVLLTGGTGSYFGSGSGGPVTADAFGSNTGTVSRTPGTGPLTSAGPYNVAFSDGQTSRTVAVTVTNFGDACP
jgi:hypothetical protein